MKTPAIKDVKTFIPCGPKGQEESIAFYKDLGFHLLWGGSEGAVCEFDTGYGHRFLLLEKYNNALSENLMLQIWVENLDDWHTYLTSIDLPKKYPTVKVSQPEVQPWGWRIIYIWDPAGVLWHIAEPHSQENKDYFNHVSWL